MKKTIKDVFEIAGHKIDFSAVDYSLKGLPRKLSMLLRAKTLDQIETTVYDSLREKWNGIESGSKEFVCFKEEDGVLCPKHVEAGRDIPFPCVFVLKCNLFMPGGKEIHLRIKIDETGDTYNESVYGVTYKYKVSEFFVCDEYGNSLLGFSQMPFPMDLKSLFLSLSRACGKESLTKEDEGKVAKNVYESWIKHGMLTDSERPLIKDTARHLTFETGLQTKDGRKVQVILWKDTATDDMYEFRVVMGMSSILDQNEADEFDSRPAPAKPTISLPVSREITISGSVVVKELALKLGIPTDRIITDLMVLKIPATIDQRIKPEEAIIVAQKYGYKVKVEHARDAANKKPVLKSINAGEEIPQDNPTYSFGPNVGGEIMAATQAQKNEQDRTEVVNLPTDTTQRGSDDASVMFSAPTARETAVVKGTVKVPNVTTQEAIINERDFLKRFLKFVKDCGYQYEPRDLIRFHTCVKCGFFTLLGGDPGAGKSSLALLYAKALAGAAYKEAEDTKTFLRVDVNPGWMEPADIMGYYSSSTREFCESEVGLVTFLREAEKKDCGLRLACLEEMNLAHVEHYFSDFIQQMSRIDGDRFITIARKFDEEKKKIHFEKIQLNNNLRFLGTVNFDETTRELSPRFYDRCNYIELSQEDQNFPRLESPVNTDILMQGCDGAEVTVKEFNEWVGEVSAESANRKYPEILGKLDEVYPILRSLHIAPSRRKACDVYKYIVSRPLSIIRNEKGSWKLILDEVIAQIILPVYRRPNDRLEVWQGKLHKFLETNGLTLSEKMFTRILEIEVPYPDEP